MDAMQTIGVVYCGISVLCAFILILNAKTISEITSRYSIAQFTVLSYLFAGLSAIFDCAFALRELVRISFPSWASFLLTVIYVVCINLTGTFWILYAEKKLNSWFSRTKKRLFFFLIPLFALTLFTVTTPLTHWFFYFENGVYMRGPLFMIISLSLLVYVAQNGVNSLIQSFRKEKYVERHEFRRLFIYAFFYLLIQAIQLIMPDVFPYRSVGVMLIFGIFLNQNMKEMIGRDGLTHINNRYALDRYLGFQMNANHDFEIVLLDVDKFKGINDRYGHVEGDTALNFVVDAIRDATPKSGFYARFGGDEFVIVNTDMNHSISNIEEKINRNLTVLTNKKNSEYQLAVSAGYITRDNSIQSIPDLLKRVDEELYIRKKAKKTTV